MDGSGEERFGCDGREGSRAKGKDEQAGEGERLGRGTQIWNDHGRVSHASFCRLVVLWILRSDNTWEMKV